ncbi:MAG: hypothetical protein H0T99_02690 [Geodermatophilaceae bacterium]|nr:hypothetical protein [Geodermatophilaceae bacterium]
MTAPSTQSGERPGPPWSAGGSLVLAVLLMAALFLAHGLQCAAALDHGPVAMSHTLLAPVAADDVMPDGSTRDRSDVTMLVSSLADPVATVTGRDVLGQAGVVCVAVLTAIGLWFLSRPTALLAAPGVLLWPAGGRTPQLRAAARWRPPAPDLAVLCVLRA